MIVLNTVNWHIANTQRDTGGHRKTKHHTTQCIWAQDKTQMHKHAHTYWNT
jgi:hypothetical protein